MIGCVVCEYVDVMNTDAKAQRAHDRAEARGDVGYLDPHTNQLVLTATYLAERGHCCGAGCRHCPYDAEEQARAGRPTDSTLWE